MGNTPEHWAEWEVDPSTRSSVHLWTKYLPLNATFTTSGITLLTVSRGIPSVNNVTNPSFESSDLTMYTEIGTGTAPPDSGGRITYASDGEVTAPTFDAAGIAGRAYVAKVTAASAVMAGSVIDKAQSEEKKRVEVADSQENITHKDNITGRILSNKITHSDNIGNNTISKPTINK